MVEEEKGQQVEGGHEDGSEVGEECPGEHVAGGVHAHDLNK